MKKGIIRETFILVLAHIMIFILISITEPVLKKLFTQNTLETFMPFIGILITTASFILYGYQLKRKYKSQITSTKFFFTGSIGSVFSVLSLVFVAPVLIRLHLGHYPEPYFELVYSFLEQAPVLMAILVVNCLFVALLFNKIRVRVKSDDSLDSDILNK